MTIPALAASFVALAWMHYYGAGLTIPAALATTPGVTLTVPMAAALMGSVFLSLGSGHDVDVDSQNRNKLFPPEQTD